VRDVALTPRRPVYRVGDEVRCTAVGNPAPRVTLRADDGQPAAAAAAAAAAGDEGSTAVRVGDPAWTRLECRASNVVDGRTHTLADAIQFTVRRAGNE